MTHPSTSPTLEVSSAPRALESWLRRILLVLGIALGVHLRLDGSARLPLFGDEYHTLLAADAGYGTILTSFDTVGSHVALPLLQRLCLDLFGPGPVSFRLVALVPGILTLLLAQPLLRGFVGKNAAALATLALAMNPMHVYYTRFARSYALGVLLALAFGWSLLIWLREGGRCRVSGAALVVTAALLPWVHLSTLGFVLAVGLTGCGLAARRSRALALRCSGLLALGGALAFLLFLPVLGQVVRYFRVMEPEDRPLGWFGVPTLIAGTRAAAVVWCVALPAAALFLGRERSHPRPAGRDALALSLAALLGPLALLLATNPRGMDYAWARYLLSALPFLVALIAAAFLATARAVLRFPAAEATGLVAGALLLTAQHLSGPIGPRAADRGPFANTYLALHPLPAFDEPFGGAPEFYRTLAADPAAKRIVETPPLYTRAVLLYRGYAAIHGKDVGVGWAGDLPRGVQGGPYRRILELGPADADYVVLHRDQKAEVRQYFSFVYDQVWPRLRRPSDETFMRRQEAVYSQNLLGPEATDGIAARLRERYGPACYKDERILVWRIGG